MRNQVLRQTPSKSTSFGYMPEALRKIVFMSVPSITLYTLCICASQLLEGGLLYVHLVILRCDLIDLIDLIVWLSTPIECELKVEWEEGQGWPNRWELPELITPLH